MMKRILTVLFLIGTAQAFAPASSVNSIRSLATPSSSNNILTNQNRLPVTSTSSSSTALSERQWNFNNGRSPWGLKKNAEIWNGRLAQMAFTTVLLQELITGKGVIASIQDGDALGLAFVGLAGVSTLGLTIWLAIRGDESEIKW
mmetsp:Transcript_6823/g.15588  ORF Transcript_6823/g.15588 Transcript_6823/m.15588 type:complete len:145 (-) Transcript_6823:77-511(-)|eukprot:CAMPEP_0172309966 /NCGR_PEP_ID=MMETSP1058-20130122/11017_1 /TAXON_ID=83371 /ORGANISM="Detonula confervacea, Strain CCMP 353" /LENGTH=144 /DNA_ID=CAMNT_0013022693 /DNA_START=87 /DNA_END=524 /DNA_ORIENTATION=+